MGNTPSLSNDNNKNIKSSKVLETPIHVDDNNNNDASSTDFPIRPTGREYDLMDELVAELPSIIDEESKRQVQDYENACDNGKGPMVACFATAEFKSLFERKHKEARLLFENTCFRPSTDKSPNAMYIPRDNSMAYPPACFNLGQLYLTGKGGIFDRKKAFDVLERACGYNDNDNNERGHGGACHLVAKLILTRPQLHPQIPHHDIDRATKLLEHVCRNKNDSLSCFTLATMLLRGNQQEQQEQQSVLPPHVRPQQVRQETEKNTNSTRQQEQNEVAHVERNPVRARELLEYACQSGRHAPSCFNLAVMYTQGDDGIPPDPEKAQHYQNMTNEMVKQFGGFGV